MKKISVVIILLLVLTSCKEHESVENSMLMDDYLVVSTSIEFYQPTMSSVPGLPIEIKTLLKNPQYLLNIMTDSGEFLSWEDGTITSLGKDVSLQYSDTTIYWSPLSENLQAESNLTVRVLSHQDVMASSDYMIVTSEMGYKLLKVVFTGME